MNAVEIYLNGERVLTQAADLQALLLERAYRLDAAMACARNNAFVPRAQWAHTALQPQDKLDVVAPITGG